MNMEHFLFLAVGLLLWSFVIFCAFIISFWVAPILFWAACLWMYRGYKILTQ